MLKIRDFVTSALPLALGATIPAAQARTWAGSVMVGLPTELHKVYTDLGTYAAAMMGNRASELATAISEGRYLPEVMDAPAYEEGAPEADDRNAEFALMYGRPDSLLESLWALERRSRAGLVEDDLSDIQDRFDNGLEDVMDWARCLKHMSTYMVSRTGIALDRLDKQLGDGSRYAASRIQDMFEEAAAAAGPSEGPALVTDTLLLRVLTHLVLDAAAQL